MAKTYLDHHLDVARELREFCDANWRADGNADRQEAWTALRDALDGVVDKLADEVKRDAVGPSMEDPEFYRA